MFRRPGIFSAADADGVPPTGTTSVATRDSTAETDAAAVATASAHEMATAAAAMITAGSTDTGEVRLESKQATAEGDAVQQWLDARGLGSFRATFKKIGVDSTEDLRFVEPKDLEEIGLSQDQIQIFCATVSS